MSKSKTDDPNPWVRPDGDRSRFPCLTAQYQPRDEEQVIRDEIEQKRSSR